MREGPGAAGLPTDVDEVLAPALSEFEAAESIASNAEWKAARPAQVSCPEADLVTQVRAVLSRHFPSTEN